MNLDHPRLIDRFDATVATLRDQHAATGPGFSIALTMEGQAVRTAHHGHAQLEWGQPLAGDTRFYLASESSPGSPPW